MPKGGLLSGSAFFLATRVTGAALTYGLYILLGRWLGKAELGAYVTAFSWCLVLSHVAALGFPRSSLRFFAEGLAASDRGLLHGYVRRARQLVVVLGIALAGTVGGVLALVVPGTPTVTLLAIAFSPVWAWTLVNASFALAMGWRRLYMLPNAVVRPAALLAGVVILWLLFDRFDALSVMATHALVMVVVAVGLTLVLHRALRKAVEPAPPRYETRTWLSTSVPLLMVSLYASYFFEYNILFLSAMLPPDAIGVLGPAHRVAFLLGFVVFAVDTASMPGLATLHRVAVDRREIQAELTRATRIKTAVVLLGFLGLVVVGKPLLGLFGEGFDEGYAMMLVMAGSVVAFALIGPGAEMLGVTGHQNVSLTGCLIALGGAPLLAMVLVPPMGAMGGAISIFVATTVSRLWLTRALWVRLGLAASVLGGRKGLTSNDLRLARVEHCGPDVTRKCYGLHVEQEHEKAKALRALFHDGPFLAPEPLSVEGPRIDYAYVEGEGTLRDAYADYLNAEDPAHHAMPDLVERAAVLLAKLHAGLAIPAAETWVPGEAFLKDLEGRGFGAADLEAAPAVPLHLDFRLQNLLYRATGEIVVLDPSPDYVSSFHPLTHGPACFDVGSLLAGLEGRGSPLRHARARRERAPALKERFLAAYNAHAENPVDPALVDAIGYCLARQQFRASFHSDLAACVAARWLYREPRRGTASTANGRGADVAEVAAAPAPGNSTSPSSR